MVETKAILRLHHVSSKPEKQWKKSLVVQAA